MREALLDVKELSGLLHIHPKTIYQWKTDGRLPFLTVNGRVRFDPRAVDDFIGNGRARFLAPKTVSTGVVLSLASYDRVHLKGGKDAVENKTRRRWFYGFGSIYLRKTKEGRDRWSIDYQDGGRRVREVVKDAQTRAEALVVLQRRVSESFDVRYNPVRKTEPIRFSRLADLYMNDYAKANKKSWRSDRSRLGAHLVPHFGAMKLQDITPLAVEKYRSTRLRSVSRSSTNREMALLKVMFNLAIDWNFVSENPLRKVKMFSEKDNLKERVLSEDEEARLLAVAAPHLRLVITALLATGARISELMALKWSTVDFERGTVLLTKTKSGRNRVIPVNAQLRDVLDVLKSRSKGERVFTGPQGRPVGSVRTSFEGACRRAGLVGLRLHDLRHTFATRLVRRGVDIITVQTLLGHSSVTTTERYTHTGEEQKREAVRRLEPKAADQGTDLTRQWHTEKEGDVRTPATLPFSVN